MEFKQVIDPESAMADVQRLMDLKKLYPKRREALTQPAEVIAEAISLGHVIIDDEGAITQKLLTPVDSVTEIKYKARVDPATISRALNNLKVENMSNILMVYLKMYSGLLEATLSKLDQTDRNTAESIALFFR